MTSETPLPSPPAERPAIVCPGCGGRNVPDALECDWCGRLFLSHGRRLRLAGWQLVSTILLLALVGALVALGVLNANRPLPAPRPAPTAVAAGSPTPAVTPRVAVAPTATARPTSTPLPGSTPSPPAPTPTPEPPPVRFARVVNTGGQGVVVRQEPGPQARFVGSLREGARVQVTGGEQTVAARQWREVEDPARGLRGWVSADFLALEPAGG